jgi:hypothetical protein
MGSRMTTVAYISTALCIHDGLQCIISAYIAQNTIYLKYILSLPILDIGWNVFTLCNVSLSKLSYQAKKY